MRDHKHLRACELADELAFAVYCATKALPREEQLGLTSQMRRSAVSVASNIVERYARHSERDERHFLDMAFASCHELEYQVSLAHRLEYLADYAHSCLASACEETSKVLNGLIRSLRH